MSAYLTTNTERSRFNHTQLSLILARATQSVENPHRHRIEGARAITIKSGSNLTFATRSIRVRSGEAIALTFSKSRRRSAQLGTSRQGGT